MPTYDVVVAGLGGFGSATAQALAERGVRVLGLDPRPPVHGEGASGGESRIVRQAYFEGEAYVPLLMRTYELWARLDRGDQPFLRRTGGLFLGDAGTRVLEGSIATARRWNLPHEVLDATEVAQRFPAFTPPAGTSALYEPDAGVVVPEAAVAAFLSGAASAGAQLRQDEAVTGWEPAGAGVEVTTTRGRVSCGALVLAPGRWATGLLQGWHLPLRTEARNQMWFRPEQPEHFGVGRLPVWLWATADGTELYGVPTLTADGSVKASVHFSGRPTPPADWTADDLAGALAPLLPGLGSRHLRTKPCWYTLTPDQHFVVGRHPASDRVVLACGFSGHGFKFTPVLGEVLADLVLEGSSEFDLSLFDPLRFEVPAGATSG